MDLYREKEKKKNQSHLVVEAGTEEDVFCSGVPLDVADPPLVTVQVHDPL